MPFVSENLQLFTRESLGATAAHLRKPCHYAEIITIPAIIVINIFLLLIILGVQSFLLNRCLLPACPSSVWKQVYTNIWIHSTIGRGYQVSVKRNTTSKAGSPTGCFNTLAFLESDQPFIGQNHSSQELEYKQIKV